MTALFLPYGNAAEVQSTGLFDAAYSGFFLQCELADYLYWCFLRRSCPFLGRRCRLGHPGICL